MRQIFLDTSYLQALVDFGDDLNPLAASMITKLGNFKSVTSEMVLTELLNALCSRGEYLRKSAIRLTRRLRSDENTLIIPQTSEQFEQAFNFYQRRLDKGALLTSRGKLYSKLHNFGWWVQRQSKLMALSLKLLLRLTLPKDHKFSLSPQVQ
jgi:hypothetical protein